MEDIAFDDIARLKSKISDTFGGWSDPSCGLNAACPVIVEGDVSLTATFDPSP